MDEEKLLQYKMMFLDPDESDEFKKVMEEEEGEKGGKKKVEVPDYTKKYLGNESEYAVCLIKEIRTIFFAPLDTNPDQDQIRLMDHWVINTERGKEFVSVLKFFKHKLCDEDVQYFARFVKLARDADFSQEDRNRDREAKAMDICKKKIEKLNLVMKLVKVHYLFDGSRIMFYFTAPSKVDFRELVKQLASVFRTRIELRQIGVRDETKLIGGIGPCGMHICCNCYLTNFKSVSIKMAKDQNLVLNPGKISGICGRLLCCLNYENETYLCERKCLPEINEAVLYEGKKARVLSLDILKHRIKIMLEDESIKEVDAADLKQVKKEHENKPENR
ncbi:MAG: regulatory iron-sulfur-containing complex subunit RicT [Candidatus Wallbacteria bacterium]|nr:regulatory iron-sulfur-containing complex subunit RicT [Candidatus Wallbacteria bacterium]